MPSPVRFAEVRKMLESLGYRLVRISGSHHIFVKPGAHHEAVPVHNGKVKHYYVTQLKKLSQGS